MNLSRTIEQLEAKPWPEPTPSATELIRRCHALRRIPVGQLEPGDLRVLIGQDIALKYLVPLALAALRAEPMLEADYYPGDLLVALMSVEHGFWANNQESLAQLGRLVRQAQELIAANEQPSVFRQVAKDIARFQARGAA